MAIKEFLFFSRIFIVIFLVMAIIPFISSEDPEYNGELPDSFTVDDLKSIYFEGEGLFGAWWADWILGNWGFLNAQELSTDIFIYIPKVWRPAQDMADQKCDICNDEDIFPYGCSQYECNALGKYCEWVNNGEFIDACLTNQGDNVPPQITPNPDVLKQGYIYDPENVVFPGENNGVKIAYQDGGNRGCIPPYTELTLGIKTDENAFCKWSFGTHPDSYETMTYFMYPNSLSQGEDYPVKYHNLTLPSYISLTDEAINHLGNGGYIGVPNGNDLYYYIRCSDYWGNFHHTDFVMEFCVQNEPDLKAPEVEIYPANPYYVQYGQTEAYFEARTNKPAECKWSFQDLPFEDMEHEMDWCSMEDFQFLNPNEALPYGCNGTFVGVHSGEDTNYFVRCKDKPWWESPEDGTRVVTPSIPVKLLGSYPLVIDEVTINGYSSGIKIKDSVEPVKLELKAKTSGGWSQEGYAICKYSYDGGNSYTPFYETSDWSVDLFKSTHVQPELRFYEGDYEIPIKCEDRAGNEAEDSINFTIELDNFPPEAVRVYYEDGNLKIITNEEAQCFYSLFDGCGYNIDEGTEMYSSDGFNHFVDWTTDSDIFVKCRDEFGNIPVPVGNTHQCTTIVRGSDYYN